MKKEKCSMKGCVVGAMMISFMVLGMSHSAYAAESSEVRIQLPVQQIFTQKGTTEVIASTFRYFLTAAHIDYPLPSGAASGIYPFEITENGSYDLSLTFTEPGEYTYQIAQAVTEKKEGYTYDDQVYTIVVYVRTTKEGKLAAETVVKNKDGDKVSALTFTNKYVEKGVEGTDDEKPVDNTKKPGGSRTNRSGVRTGDDSNVGMFFGLGSVAIIFILLAGLRIFRKRRDY